MWPWEHLAVGYLLYSGYVHFRGDEAPTPMAAVAVALGTQFPDLVDKPLAWTFGFLSSGVSLAHSVFVAVGVSTFLIVLAKRRDRTEPAIAFVVGYLSHLPADVLYPALLGRGITIETFLWPFVIAPAPVRSGFGENFVYYFVQFLAFLGTERGMTFLVLEVVLLAVAVLVWRFDGYPGLPALSRTVSHPK